MDAMDDTALYSNILRHWSGDVRDIQEPNSQKSGEKARPRNAFGALSLRQRTC